MRRSLYALVLGGTVLLAGCGGRQGVAPAPSSPRAASALVSFAIVVPARHQAGRNRHLEYVSSGTSSASIAVSPGGTTASVNCTSVCSGAVAAPIGSDTFTVKLYDQTNAAGNVLSQGATTQTIVANQANTVSLTFNPVPAAIAFSLASQTIPAGTATSVPVTVVATDAQNQTIVGPGVFVDSAGNPITFTLSTTDSTSGGTGKTTLSTTTVTAPSSTPITLSYNGGAMYGTLLHAAASSGSVQANDYGITFTPSAVARYPMPSGHGYAPIIAVGSDGNLWFGESGANAIARMTPSGTITEFATTNEVQGVALGPDGNIWATEFNGNYARVTPAGGVTEFHTGHQIPGPIAKGSDGNMWFTDTTGNAIYRATVASPPVVTKFTVPTASSFPYAICAGPDGNVWFVEAANAGNRIGRITPAGAITEFPVPTANASLSAITTGPDGNLWFTEAAGTSKVGRILAAAPNTITEFSSGVPAFSGLSSIATGGDGNLWVAARNAGAIDSVTTAGAVQAYSLPVSGSQPGAIVKAPDGTLWFSDQQGFIGTFVW